MGREKKFDESILQIDCPRVRKVLVGFVRDELSKAGFSKGIIGLSGGVDSALSAAISAEALGAENVLGVILPYKESNPGSLKDANAVAKQLGIKTIEINITPMVDPYFQRYGPDAEAVRRGNVMARQRMIVLYDISHKENALVIGTSNRTEIFLGYSTLWGDSAHAVNPLGDLLKTQVWQLAKHYSLPENIIAKPPSADLWEGQTDEEELGLDYRTADKVITLLIDQRIPPDKIPEYGLPMKVVERVVHLIKSNQFKRMPPIIAKLSHRTLGHDFRYPRDWGK